MIRCLQHPSRDHCIKYLRQESIFAIIKCISLGGQTGDKHLTGDPFSIHDIPSVRIKKPGRKHYKHRYKLIIGKLLDKASPDKARWGSERAVQSDFFNLSSS